MRPLIALILLVLAGAAAAGSVKGVRFAHYDWMLACDNTRTCRAAGYRTMSAATCRCRCC